VKASRLAILLGVLLLIVEVSLRIWMPDTLVLSRIVKSSDNKIMGYELRPGASGVYHGTLCKIPASLIEISSQGFRDRVFTQNGPQAMRVACVGDSYIFGLGLNLKESVPKKLEDLLNSHSPAKYEVMDCGVIGYNLEQEIEFIKQKVTPYHPDIIILFISSNDIDRKIVIPQNRISNALFAGSYIYRQIIFSLNKLQQKEDQEGLDFQDRMDSAVRSFRELRGFLAHGQRVVLVHKNFDRWMEPIVQIAKDSGYPVLDFSAEWRAFKDKLIIARQDQHFNALGAGLLAKRIRDALIQEKLLK